MNGDRYIHIVSFDIPYPPDYGGIIDVFYKIKYLYQYGYKIILHCFQYHDKLPSDELNKYCERIYYYTRGMSLKNNLSHLPFTVKSRIHPHLLQNLLKDDYPIIFETLHTAYYITHPELKKRKKILRLSNIEHHYYYHLFLNEKNFIKKIYFLIESIKLYFFEKKIFPFADIILPVTQKDVEYVQKYYSNKNVHLIPSFHPFNDVAVCKGKGDYLLYHANLSVAENYKAAEYLMKNIAPKMDMSVIIAGKHPPKFLMKKSEKYKNVQIVENPDENEMKQLIQNAHIVWLYTNQPTGLKLKLVYSLFTARFILCNDKMLAGTDIQPNLSLHIKNTPKEMIETIQYLKELEFDDEAVLQRNQIIEKFDNKRNIKAMMEIIANS